MFSKLKQFKELRDQAKDMQKELAKHEVTGSSHFGKITVTMNGNQEVTKVHIDEELLNNQEKVQAGVLNATNDALSKVKKVMMNQMRQMKDFDLSKLGMS